MLDDRAVLDGERVGEREHVLVEGRVMRVRHRRRDDARGRRGHERLDEAPGRVGEDARELGAFGIDEAAIEIADVAGGLRRVQQAHHRAREVGDLQREEALELHDVAHDRPRAGAAEAAHAVLHVREKALAWLLAVVTDIDAGAELTRDDVAGRGLDLARERRRIDRFAPAQPHQHLEQRRATRQAAGMRREDALVTALHRRPPCRSRDRRRDGASPRSRSRRAATRPDCVPARSTPESRAAARTPPE